MRKRLVVLLLSLFLIPTSAVEVEGNIFKLSDEEVAQCRDQGGCALVTKEKLVDAMQRAYDRGASATKAACRTTL